MLLLLLVLASSLAIVKAVNLTDGRRLDFAADLGAIPDDHALSTCEANSRIFQDALTSLTYGEVFVVPNSGVFCMQGGIIIKGMRGGTVEIAGELRFQNDRESWPKKIDGFVEEAIYMEDIEDVVFTTSQENVKSNKKGVINGQGRKWWGAIRMLIHGEDRPRLWHIVKSRNLTVEYLLLLDSPYWTFYSEQSDGLRIHHCDVSARITDLDRHDLYDLTAFNTDGFDVTGRDVYISDCNIWNQDDCIAVKDDPVESRDMLFERINCSGLGLVVGSIGASRVQNITFRDSYLHHSFKGIYLKSRWDDNAPRPSEAYIKDILYENIVIDEPEQWAVWIGPAQQTGQPCSLLWPKHHGKCAMSGFMTWSNIVLRNITIFGAKQSPGVIIGNASNPIMGLEMDNVVVHKPKTDPFEAFWWCEGVAGAVFRGTTPAPKC